MNFNLQLFFFALVVLSAEAFSGLQVLPLRSRVAGRAVQQQHLELRFASRPSVQGLSMAIEGDGQAILLAEEIFGQVAAGGIGIILSGIVGAFIVGNIANLDELEESFAEDRRPSGEAVKDDDDDYDTGGVEEIVVAPEKKEGAQ